MKKKKSIDDLDRTVNELVRNFGIMNVIRSVVGACDTSADFAHQTNDKRLENYWRTAAVAIFDSIRHIDNLPEKSKKY